MSTAATVDYVAQRAELLAQLVLTRRRSVRVLSFKEPADIGLEFIVQLPPLLKGGKTSQPQSCFGVQVEGTSEPLEDERRATAYAKQQWKHLSLKGFFLAPIAFLLFSMEGDRGYFSWLMEPQVKPGRDPSLTRVTSPDMTKITKMSIDIVFDEVERWFEAMAEILLRD
jgi:hypothetical protein